MVQFEISQSILSLQLVLMWRLRWSQGHCCGVLWIWLSGDLARIVLLLTYFD